MDNHHQPIQSPLAPRSYLFQLRKVDKFHSFLQNPKNFSFLKPTFMIWHWLTVEAWGSEGQCSRAAAAAEGTRAHHPVCRGLRPAQLLLSPSPAARRPCVRRCALLPGPAPRLWLTRDGAPAVPSSGEFRHSRTSLRNAISFS